MATLRVCHLNPLPLLHGRINRCILAATVDDPEQALDIIERATLMRPEANVMARLQELRRMCAWEEVLATAQTLVDVLDVRPLAHRASIECQQKYDTTLARVDEVLREAPPDAHPRRLAEAVRRQVVAARAGRPPSPEVADVLVDDPSSWGWTL